MAAAREADDVNRIQEVARRISQNGSSRVAQGRKSTLNHRKVCRVQPQELPRGEFRLRTFISHNVPAVIRHSICQTRPGFPM